MAAAVLIKVLCVLFYFYRVSALAMGQNFSLVLVGGGLNDNNKAMSPVLLQNFEIYSVKNDRKFGIRLLTLAVVKGRQDLEL
jgi:hypothetical protein